MSAIRNVPVSCPRCKNMVSGKEQIMETSDQIKTICQWRCGRCGTFVKHGVIKIENKKK